MIEDRILALEIKLRTTTDKDRQEELKRKIEELEGDLRYDE